MRDKRYNCVGAPPKGPIAATTNAAPAVISSHSVAVAALAVAVRGVGSACVSIVVIFVAAVDAKPKVLLRAAPRIVEHDDGVEGKNDGNAHQLWVNRRGDNRMMRPAALGRTGARGRRPAVEDLHRRGDDA